MKIYHQLGIVLGVVIIAFSMNYAWNQYYVFVGPNEAWVHFGGHRDSFRIEQFAEVNNLLENAPGGRKAFIYPTSGSSLSIVYLPRNNKHLDQVEREEIARSIREKFASSQKF